MGRGGGQDGDAGLVGGNVAQAGRDEATKGDQVDE